MTTGRRSFGRAGRLRRTPAVQLASGESRIAGIVDRIRHIPAGSVQTYGEIDPGAPRLVGRVLATTHQDLPWQRVIRADGSIPKGQHQRELLLKEGVPMRGDRVDLDQARIVSSLPASVAGYIRAADASDALALVSCFARDAEVTDGGRTWQGQAEIRRWWKGSANKYEYKVDVRGSTRISSNRYIVQARLTGNFPSGTADLRYSFTLREGLIRVLKISP